jgi:hypothetical protein
VTALGLSGNEGKPFETETRVGRFDEERPHGNILGWYGMTLISTTRTLMQKNDKAQADGCSDRQERLANWGGRDLSGFEDQVAKDKQESLQDCIASRNYELS